MGLGGVLGKIKFKIKMRQRDRIFKSKNSTYL